MLLDQFRWKHCRNLINCMFFVVLIQFFWGGESSDSLRSACADSNICGRGGPWALTARELADGFINASHQRNLEPPDNSSATSLTGKTSGHVPGSAVWFRDVSPSGIQRCQNCTGYQRVKRYSCTEVTLTHSAYCKDSKSFPDKIEYWSQNQ